MKTLLVESIHSNNPFTLAVSARTDIKLHAVTVINCTFYIMCGELAPCNLFEMQYLSVE